MSSRRWGISRWVLLVFGIVALLATMMPGWETTIPGQLISFGIAIVLLAVALGASDELLHRIRLILWDRKWPR